VSLLFLEILRHAHTAIPFFLPQTQVIRINQVVDLFLDGSDVSRDIFFGEELLLFLVVEFIVADGTDLGGFGLGAHLVLGDLFVMN